MTYNEIAKIVSSKLRENVTILENGEIHCCATNYTIGRDICAIIKPFEGNRPEFEVILEEYCAGLSHSMAFDDIDKFIVEFKKIINAMDQIDEIIKNLVFC